MGAVSNNCQLAVLSPLLPCRRWSACCASPGPLHCSNHLAPPILPPHVPPCSRPHQLPVLESLQLENILFANFGFNDITHLSALTSLHVDTYACGRSAGLGTDGTLGALQVLLSLLLFHVWAEVWRAACSSCPCMLLSQPTDGMPAAPQLQALTRLELLTLVNLASDHGLQHLRSVTQLRCAKGKSCGLCGLLVAGYWPSLRGRRSASAACGTQAVLALTPALYLWLHGIQYLRCSFKMLNHTYGSPDDTDEGAVGRIDYT